MTRRTSRLAVANPRSDVAAKAAFAKELRRRGYERVFVTKSPTDITAYLGTTRHYFEVKFTNRVETYFGAATLTEWEAALANEECFRFVVAKRAGRWVFQEYTPEQFMKFSSIPPFKAYFNLPLGSQRPIESGRANRRSPASRAVRLTRERLRRMLELYRSFRLEG